MALLAIGELDSPKVHDLNRWWHGQRRAGDLPDRDDFDPAQWKAYLPFLLISDCSRDPFRIRYRLVGTAVVYVVGFDFTWRHLDAMLGGIPGEDWMANYRRAFDHRQPVYGTAMVSTLGGDPFRYDFGIFPLSHFAAGKDGSGQVPEVRQFLAIEDYGAFQPRVQSTLLDLTIRSHRRAAPAPARESAC
ncbi:PAS domain-containing protein [Dongia mobilis]|uniref:PAS domain-containing protein n=1 Tax=Dongia mobilis TaxID=578943 RepID=A0A4R6WQI0_9PROT|nr:PAS domain-containing protein [Dongia mobilis]TDQ81510.1 PAS domain-containing protein [Dongia mobilis]